MMCCSSSLYMTLQFIGAQAKSSSCNSNPSKACTRPTCGSLCVSAPEVKGIWTGAYLFVRILVYFMWVVGRHTLHLYTYQHIHIDICTYTDTHTHMQHEYRDIHKTYTYAYAYTYTCTCSYTYMYVHMHRHIHVRTPRCIFCLHEHGHVHMRLDMRVYTRSHIHKQIFICIHIAHIRTLDMCTHSICNN